MGALTSEVWRESTLLSTAEPGGASVSPKGPDNLHRAPTSLSSHCTFPRFSCPSNTVTHCKPDWFGEESGPEWPGEGTDLIYLQSSPGGSDPPHVHHTPYECHQAQAPLQGPA